MATQSEIPILIVGGGLIGLSASLFLSHYGIKSMVIERHANTSVHPRARSVNARSMELFRHLDLENAIRDAGISISPSIGIYSGISLKGIIEKHPRNPGKKTFPFAHLVESVGPVHGTFATQDLVEPVLVNAARDRGVDIRFSTEYLSLHESQGSVTATIRNRKSGDVSIIQAKYLIAADGAKSPIRTQLRIPTTGQGSMGHLLNILFCADLEALVHQREFSLCTVDHPEVHGLFASIDNSNRWVFQLSYDPSKGERISDFPAERCKELLRIAIGIPDIDIEIKSILPWEPSVRVAEHFQHGRVFLAGDAAHQMPPWGGQGGNSGIADAQNLAWKLSAVLRGYGGHELLETYDAERRPATTAAAEASALGVDRYGLISVSKNFDVISGWIKKLPLLSGHGYQYASQAVCPEDVFPMGGLTWRPWTIPSLCLALDGRPGSRVPHMWIEYKGKRISTLDLTGANFVLFVGENGTPWLSSATHVSKMLGVTILVYQAARTGDFVTSAGQIERAMGISTSGAVLVRPDDFVAWRERRGAESCENHLRQSMERILCCKTDEVKDSTDKHL